MNEALQGEVERVGNAASQRKLFEDKVAAVQANLRDMATEDLDPVKEQPLTALAIDKDLAHFKVLWHVYFFVKFKSVIFIWTR